MSGHFLSPRGGFGVFGYTYYYLTKNNNSIQQNTHTHCSNRERAFCFKVDSGENEDKRVNVDVNVCMRIVVAMQGKRSVGG